MATPAVTPWHLGDAAAVNSVVRQRDALAAMAADASGRLGDFRDHAAGAAASTNADAAKIVAFDEASEVLDGRRYDIHRAGGDVPAGLAAFAARQGSWLVRREAFESLWHGGDRFVYAALNSGGLGVRGRFGEFCLVVEDPTGRARATALLPDDSAQRYTDVDGNVDVGQVRQEITVWADRDALAIIERGAEAILVPRDGWPRLVCREGRYLETVLEPPLPVEDISAVRLAQPYLDRLTELQVRELAGESLTPVEQREALAFSALQVWRSAHGTNVEGLAS